MTIRTSFQPNEVDKIVADLAAANKKFMQGYPGESNRRQAVQTVYGGGHLFKADTARRLGDVALNSLKEFAPDAPALAKAFGMNVSSELAQKIYDRIVEKLTREPVEDFRLDYEDGYGNRPDAE